MGWLVGNLYSRVGTPDWADYEGDKRKDTLVKEYLDDAIPEDSWVPDSWIKSAVAEGVDLISLQGPPANELRKYAPTPPLNVMIDEVCKTALAVKIDAYGQMFADSISRNGDLRSIFARDVVSHFKEHLTPEESESFVSILLEAASFTHALTVSVRSMLAAAKNHDDGDAVIKAIEVGGQSSKCLPLLRKSIESVLSVNLGKQLNTMSDLFERSPFLTKKSMDECRKLVESAGHASWLTELASLRKRLASSGKLKSVTDLRKLLFSFAP